MIIALGLLFALMAVEAEIDSGTWGNLEWTLSDEGVLTINGFGTMDALGYNSDNAWLAYKSTIKQVIISNGITNIGGYAFRECNSLANIIIPESIISIDGDAFYKCKSLKSIDFPEKLEIIQAYAFGSCVSLNMILSAAATE